MNETNNSRFEFKHSITIGSYLFHPALNQLVRDGNIIHLEPKAASVLELLAERVGETVSRQELLDSVWPGVVVSDDALTQVIIKLRKALGDTSRQHSYIKTVPKRGYLLVATVEKVVAQHSEQKTVKDWLIPRFVIITIILLFIAINFLFWEADDSSPTNGMTTDTPSEPRSISILPFESINEGERYRNFARGITADLTTDLSKISKLWVIRVPMTGDNVISARYLVSGSIQHTKDRIIVHVRLLESRTRHHIWSERYEQSLDKLFDVQQAINKEIVKQLAIEITTADKYRLAKRYTYIIDAYEDFLHGQADLLLRQQESNISAREWYHQAIEKDPAFARAYAGLALSYAADYRNQWTSNGEYALNQAEEMAKTAKQIDPNIPEVYWVLGYVKTQKKKLDDAINLLHQALELDKSYADAYALMGGVYTYIGEPKLSLPHLRNAIRLNPNAGYLYYLLLGRAYFFLNDHEQATINLKESLSRNPDNLEARIYLMASAIVIEDWDTAEWEANEIRVIQPKFRLSSWLDTYPMTDRKQRQYLLGQLQLLGF